MAISQNETGPSGLINVIPGRCIALTLSMIVKLDIIRGNILGWINAASKMWGENTSNTSEKQIKLGGCLYLLFKQDLTANFHLCFHIANSASNKLVFTKRGIICSHKSLKHILSVVAWAAKSLSEGDDLWDKDEEDCKCVQIYNITKCGLVEQSVTSPFQAAQKYNSQHTYYNIDPRTNQRSKTSPPPPPNANHALSKTR